MEKSAITSNKSSLLEEDFLLPNIAHEKNSSLIQTKLMKRIKSYHRRQPIEEKINSKIPKELNKPHKFPIFGVDRTSINIPNFEY